MTKEEKNAYMKNWRAANRDKVLATKAAYRERNREQLNAKQREYNKTHREEDNERCRAWRKRHPEKVAARGKQYREANQEKEAARQRRYREENYKRVTARERAYRTNNLEKVRASQQAYARRNPQKRLAAAHKRRAAKLQATPIWADGVDRYVEDLALQRTDGHHIDHIVPLRGKKHSTHPIQLVCGLHAVNNLELISAAANLAKNCHTWPDMWGYDAEHMLELEALQSPPLRSAMRMKHYV